MTSTRFAPLVLVACLALAGCGHKRRARVPPPVRPGQTETGIAILIEPALLQRLVTAIAAEVERSAARGQQAVLLSSSRVRRPLRRLIERSLPALPVLAYAEITSEVEVESVGMVEV